MRNGQPDCVPVAPDTSNMIPCRLTGKPFWDIYLYQDPPLWQAYNHVVKYFGFDGWKPDAPVQFDDEMEAAADAPQWREAIVHRTPERIYTRSHATIDGKMNWSEHCTVYYVADSPTSGVPLWKVKLPPGPPSDWEDVTPRTSYPGRRGFDACRAEMGADGVVGCAVGIPGLSLNPESIYQYYDDPGAVIGRCEREHEWTVRRTRRILELAPDFVLISISGYMLSNPEPIFRRLGLPTLQAVTRLCKDAGVPSQIHCCGPEYTLVKIAAEESDLSSINPLEIPPMGDCSLSRVKREFGGRLSLMGNLHTTSVMLHGTPQEVAQASKQAIEDAAEGGGFILSTGDQCGRDTPDANIFAMIDTARTCGKY